MSVYIENMDLPKTCKKCRLSYYDQEEGYLRCPLLNCEVCIFSDEKPGSCPLKELKK